MRTMFFCMGFSRRESLLGLTVMALAVALTLPFMKAALCHEQVQRAGLQAQAVAQAVLDYNADTGQWPHTHEGLADLSELVSGQAPTGAETLVGSLLETHGQSPWLAEQPRDPWNRPYLVLLPEETGDDRDQRAVIVVSAGPDGRLDTGIDQLELLSRSGRLAAGPLASGDDVGYLLRGGEGPETP